MAVSFLVWSLPVLAAALHYPASKRVVMPIHRTWHEAGQLQNVRPGYNDEPKWIMTPPSGGPTWVCGAYWLDNTTRRCSADDVELMKSIDILSNGTFKPADVAYEIMYMESPPCKSTKGNSSKPYRVVLDTHFANWPRCCTDAETEDLKVTEWGSCSGMVKEVDNILTTDGDLVRLDPPNQTCTADKPCALVLALPGAAGNPWLLYQAGCKFCAATLRAVLVSSKTCLKYDCFSSKVMPSVKNILERSSGAIDAQKVYLVSTSKGNELGLRAAMAYPDVFTAIVLTGQFRWSLGGFSSWTKESTLGLMNNKSRKLKFLQFHVGANDTNQGTTWWEKLALWADNFPVDNYADLRVDVRIYEGAEHPVWFAAWNALHASLWFSSDWIGNRVHGTCMGPDRLHPA